MKLQFVPHGDSSPRGIAGPVTDLHDTWLAAPRYVPVDHPDCCMVLTPGQYLDLHEIRDRHWVMWMGSNPDFVKVNSKRHPELFS